MAGNPYATDLDKNDANFAPLTPLSFLERTATAHPHRLSVIHGERRFTWKDTYARARRLASALHRRGLAPGDTVATMLPNVPAMFEAHFGVPMCGAVLNTLNTRLDAQTIAFMLDHGEARVLLTDREFAPVVAKALSLVARRPIVIDVDDPLYTGPGERLGEISYEALLEEGDPEWAWPWPKDEWDAISLNYTSGTTGDPKGVVFHHRGAYLAAVGNLLVWSMPPFPVFLWALPMFHCNGWCFAWALAAGAGTSVCLRKVEAAAIFDLMRQHRVTHYCGAPIVHATLINAPDALKQGIDWKVSAFIAGAAPPVAIIEGVEKMGFSLTHVYGLTEVYGPATICAKLPEWDDLPLSERARLNGRQGVRYPMEEGFTVMDPDTMTEVPADGETMGELMFRGNMTMKGYLKNPKATQEAFRGGWFHSGDLGVRHADGYVKIKDRAKDIIISGGENISSLEVEEALYRHPSVLLAAVVAEPDPKWGEIPCAFVELKEGRVAQEAEIIEFCRGQMAHFKAPKRVVFGALPKTSTGKIQKFVLRERARSASAIE